MLCRLPALYVLVLVVTAGFCCLLKPASHAPLLFRPNTNLQTLLGLRSNLSAQGISCHTCSGKSPRPPWPLLRNMVRGLVMPEHLRPSRGLI